MARAHVADHSFLLGAFVAAVATAVGAGTALTGLLVFSFGANPNAVVDTTSNPRFLHGSAPSTRDAGSVERDVETMIRVQERRNARLQQLHMESEAAEDVPHSSAPVERRIFSAAEYSDAYGACEAAGYTRSRLAYCIDSILQTGEYENDRW